MASGRINGSSKYNHQMYISWSSSAGTGGSTVSATLYMYVEYYYNYTNRRGCSLTINGSSVSGSGKKVNGAGTYSFLSHSVWVAYTGNKSVTISGSVDLGDVTNSSSGNKLGTYTASGTAALDRVGSAPSNSSFTYPTSSVTFSELGGNITVTWGAFTDYSGNWGATIQVSVNGGAWTTLRQATGMTSYTYAIPAGQGNTYRFRAQGYNDVGWSEWCYSGTVTTNWINPPTTVSVANNYNPFVNGTTLTVSISGGGNSSGAAVRRMFDLYDGGTIIASSGWATPNNNTTATVSYSTANWLARLGTNAYTKTFRVVAWNENANRSRSGYVERSFTVNINTDGGATPTIGAPTFSGGAFSNPATCFIAGISTLTVTSATGVTRRAPSGTTLSYTIQLDGGSTTNSKTANFSSLTAGTKTVRVTVTDSRGLSASTTKQLIVQPWAKPTVTISSCDRISTAQTTAKLVYSMSYSPIYQYTSLTTQGNQLNSINIQQYQLNGGTWNTASNNMTISGLDTEMTYTLILRCSDKVKPTDYASTPITIPTIRSLLSIRAHGVGIGTIPALAYSLDVGGDVRITNGGLFLTSYGSTQQVIEPINGTSSGMGVRFSGKGDTILGAGGSAMLVNPTTSDGNLLYLTSDSAIHWYTGATSTLSAAKHGWIDSSGNMTVAGNIATSGSVSASSGNIGNTLTVNNITVKGTGVMKEGSWWTQGSTTNHANNISNSQINFAYTYSSNHGVAATGTLVTFVNSNHRHPFQINTEYNTGRMWVRAYNSDNSTWSNWHQMARFVDLTYANLSGSPANLQIGGGRTNLSGNWIGFYTSSGTRVGWLGENNSGLFHINSEAGPLRIDSDLRASFSNGCDFYGYGGTSMAWFDGSQYNFQVGSGKPDGSLGTNGGVVIGGTLQTWGTKNRVVETKDFGNVALNAVESPSCLFQDYGHGKINEQGYCYIFNDEVFKQTTSLNIKYNVQLTKYDEGDLWCSEQNEDYFIVKGTPNLEFSWVITGTQKGYEAERLTIAKGKPIDRPESEVFNKQEFSQLNVTDRHLMESAENYYQDTLDSFVI